MLTIAAIAVNSATKRFMEAVRLFSAASRRFISACNSAPRRSPTGKDRSLSINSLSDHVPKFPNGFSFIACLLD
jgi:hypothetical protein